MSIDEIEQPRRRRIMRQFRIDEISAVTDPAQEGATMAIMKGRETPLPLSGRSPVGRVALKSDTPTPESPETFSDAVVAIRGRDRISTFEAMRKAAREHPGLVAKYRQPEDAKVVVPVVKREIVTFNARVDQIQTTQKCSRLDALRQAARELPATEFSAFRNA